MSSGLFGGTLGNSTLWGGGTPGGVGPSAQSVIYLALRRCGQLRPGWKPSPELNSDALLEWSVWFDELGAEPNTAYSNPVYVYPVTGPGSQTGGNGYQIGPTAIDWRGPRPSSIIRANLVLTNSQPQPVYIPLIPLTQEEWAGLAVLQIPATSTTSLYWYDPQFPNGVFNVFPPINGNSIQIYQRGILAPPATITSAYSAPPGYWEMVVSGLAERLYGLVVGQNLCRSVNPYPIVAGKARLAYDRVRNANRQLQTLVNDAPSGSQGGGIPSFDRFVYEVGEPE